VARDHLALRASSHTIVPTAAYDRHDIITREGTRVREFVSRTGTVFAVAWSGPSLPSLKTLLASHYDEYVSGAAARRSTRHVMSLTTPGLILHITRLPRGFSGSAQIPDLVPAGTSPADLR
jgi:hypothetical protein